MFFVFSSTSTRKAFAFANARQFFAAHATNPLSRLALILNIRFIKSRFSIKFHGGNFETMKDKRLPLVEHKNKIKKKSQCKPKMTIQQGLKIAKAISNSLTKTEVQSSHGKCGSTGIDGVSISSFNFKPQRRAKDSKFDRANCEHGVIYNHEVGKYAGTPDLVYYATGLYNKWPATALSSIRNKFASNAKVVAPSGIPPVVLGFEPRLVAVDWIKREYQFVNEQQDGVWVTLYDCKLKKAYEGGLVPPPSAEIINNFNEADNSNTAGYGILTNYYDPDVKPTDVVALLQSWSIANVTKVYLRPGELHKHTTFFRTNFIYDLNADVARNVNVSAPRYGLEHCLLIRLEGKPVRLKTDTTKVATNATNVNYMFKERIHVHQRIPFLDKFAWNQTAWAQQLKVGTDFEGMEEVVHSIQSQLV